MPLYEYCCTACGMVEDVIRWYPERDDPLDCDPCGAPMVRVIRTPPSGIVKNPAVPKRSK